MTNAQQLYMEDAVDDANEAHRIEMDELQAIFERRELENKKELQGLWNRINELVKGEKNKENLMELLQAARTATTEAQDARDDLKDQIAGLQARIEHREEVHLKKVADDKKEAERLAGIAKDKNDNEQMLMKEAVDAARRELAKSQDEVHEQKMELAAKRDAKVKHEMEMARVQDLYNKAKRDIARRKKDSSASDAKCDDFAESHKIEEDLTKSRDTNRELNAELVEQRLELLRLKEDHKDALAAMQAALDMQEAGESQQGKGIAKTQRRVGKQKGGKPGALAPKGKGKLAAIEEEFDDDELKSNAASAISGVVSSEGVGVGDLADFDDDSQVKTKENEQDTSAIDEATTQRLNARIDVLLEQLDAAGTLNRQLLDDKSNLDAEHSSKVHRMQAQLKYLRSEQYANNDLVEAQKKLNYDARQEQWEDLIKEQEKLREMEANHKQNLMAHEEVLNENAATHDLALESLRQELYYAVEAKRIESGRLADTKRELEQVEMRHRSIVDDLNARLRLSQAVQSQSGEAANQQQLVDKLREVEHERNLLKNAGDSLKVQLQTQLEQEQLQHAVTNTSLEKIETEIATERKLAEEYKERLLQAQEELEGLKKEVSDASKQQEAGLQAQTTPHQQPKPFLAFLWCPVRGSAKKVGAATRASAAIGTSISTVIWQVVATLRGVVALQCSTAQLQIKEASRRAFEIWGSSSLRSAGSSVLQSLVFDERSANWLRQEIAQRIQLSDSFWIRQLGCLEFRSKSGVAFDSVVIAAHLPRETEHGNDASVVVIVEPMDDDKPVNKWGGDYGRQSSVESSHSGRPRMIGGTGQLYGHDVSSTTSSEIGPNDSISNVF